MLTTNDDCTFANMKSVDMRGGTFQNAAFAWGTGMLPAS